MVETRSGRQTGFDDMEAQLQALQDDLALQQAQSQALLQQLQQQQALIQQLLQAQQALIVPPQAPAVPFTLTPAQGITDVIDLTETAGIKLHKAVTAPLVTPYDGSLQKLASFLEDVKQHATDCGWMAADGLLIINNPALSTLMTTTSSLIILWSPLTMFAPRHSLMLANRLELLKMLIGCTNSFMILLPIVLASVLLSNPLNSRLTTWKRVLATSICCSTSSMLKLM